MTYMPVHMRKELEKEILKQIPAIEARAAKHGYKPYSGGAGPSKQHVARNNYALAKAMERRGVGVKFVKDYDGEQIEVVFLGRTRVCYDRWGWNTQNKCRKELDQAPLREAIELLLYAYWLSA